MKRLACLLFLLASPAYAQRQNIFSTRAMIEFGNALTQGSLFGVPRYTTVALPVCDTTQKGAIAWNTTTASLYACDGSAWAAAGGSFTGGTVAGATVFTPGIVTFGTAQDAANAIMFNETAGRITFEGATADAFETRLGVTDPTVGDQTFLLPNLGAAASDTIATLGAVNAFTTTNSFAGSTTMGSNTIIPSGLFLSIGTSPMGTLYGSTTATPDTAYWFTNALANSFHLAEAADYTFDFNNGHCGTSACTDPTFSIHSHNQSTAQWLDLYHDGTNAHISAGTGVVDFPNGLSSSATTASFSAASGEGVTMGSNNRIAFGSHLEIGSTTVQTPDSAVLYTQPTSNAFHVFEFADVGFDFANGPAGTVAATDPEIVVHSHNQDTTQYSAVAFYGSAGQALKTLTESSATAVVAIPVASDTGSGGEINYTVFASDGTGQQARNGHVRYAAVAEGTASTCAIYGVDLSATGIAGPTLNPDQTEDGSGGGALTTGTLTYAWTSTAGTNLCTFNLNAVSSLTQTTLQIKYRVDHVGLGQPTPQ